MVLSQRAARSPPRSWKSSSAFHLLHKKLHQPWSIIIEKKEKSKGTAWKIGRPPKRGEVSKTEGKKKKKKPCSQQGKQNTITIPPAKTTKKYFFFFFFEVHKIHQWNCPNEPKSRKNLSQPSTPSALSPNTA